MRNAPAIIKLITGKGRPNRALRAQRGYAAITLIAILGIATTTLYITLLDSNTLRNNRDRNTAAALALAKQALIGRAAADQTSPGSLSCPDLVTNIANNVPNDGIADLFAGNNCPSYVGRLPWRTLGLPDLRDADGERLWYALSPNFRDYASLVPINDATVGTLSVSGTITATNVVAIVFSPGSSLAGQLRDTAANQNNVVNYLDGVNTAGGPAFVAQAAAGNFNDRLAVITVADLMPVVERRVAYEVMSALNTYFQANGALPTPADINCDSGNNPTACVPSGSTASPGRLPSNGMAGTWPALLGANTSWFDSSNWRASFSYTVAAACTTTSPSCAITGFTPLGSGSPLVTFVVGSTTTLTVGLIPH